MKFIINTLSKNIQVAIDDEIAKHLIKLANSDEPIEFEPFK